MDENDRHDDVNEQEMNVNPCPNGFMYTIMPGDTIYRLSLRFNVSVDAILRANPGIDPDNLRIGQRICIPIKPIPECPNGFLYIIQPGDTFYKLAQRFGVSVDAIIAANPGVNPNNLQIGQRICIPIRPIPECPGGFPYIIRAGDTFYKLAQRFGVSVNDIIAANPGVNPNNLQIGQRVCIPFN